MDELEEIKKRRLAQLQDQINKENYRRSQDDQQLAEQLRQLEATVKPRMSKEAVERYGSLRVAHPEKAVHSLLVIVQLIQKSPNLGVSDQMYKDILMRLETKKQNIIITRK